MDWNKLIRITVPLAILSICLSECYLYRHNETFRRCVGVLLSQQQMLLVFLSIELTIFIFLTFQWTDLLIIIVATMVIVIFCLGAEFTAGLNSILFTMTLGKGLNFVIKTRNDNTESRISSELGILLIGLIGLLALAAWWHLDRSANFYHGPRWMGIWDNPNIYGMLMGVGVVLAIGLLGSNLKPETGNLKSKNQNPPSPGCGATGAESGKRETDESTDFTDNRRFLPFFFLRKSAKSAEKNWSGMTRALPIVLFIAAGMMAVGLVMSYSRGAWLATSIGLVYLAWSYGKVKWKFLVIGAGLVALGAVLFWGRTADSAPWYLKRLDLSRPSAQHRVSAWRGALQMMRDHPFGVGWNKAVNIYDKDYSPPEGGAAALTMNSYLMLGTELGLPGLLCFVAYVGLCYRRSPRIQKSELRSQNRIDITEPISASLDPRPSTLDLDEALRAAYLSGALVFVVAFWFDGGLFTLATASVFWILLELGSVNATLS